MLNSQRIITTESACSNECYMKPCPICECAHRSALASTCDQLSARETKRLFLHPCCVSSSTLPPIESCDNSHTSSVFFSVEEMRHDEIDERHTRLTVSNTKLSPSEKSRSLNKTNQIQRYSLVH
jgi:hypothetical protein